MCRRRVIVERIRTGCVRRPLRLERLEMRWRRLTDDQRQLASEVRRRRRRAVTAEEQRAARDRLPAPSRPPLTPELYRQMLAVELAPTAASGRERLQVARRHV